ncbi:PGAP1-like alpha/beta domain-containing protein [Pedococcus dokdonensis]|uniref:PGAP1-like alpha/beta domain-containing protein n=1 Tax=Pedococcus dokdonensis TaxID=443156 RepID=UPI0012FD414C|nr:hypothetical protein [Pedococcus dokdonensis]
MVPGPHGLSIRGGSGGTAVGLDSLDRAALGLAGAVEEGLSVARGASAAAADVDVVAGGVLSRSTGVAVIVSLTETTAALTGELLALVELAVSVHVAAAAYREGEAAVARAVEVVQDRVMAVAGLLAPELLVGFLALDAAGVDVLGVADRVALHHPQVAELAGGAEGLGQGLRADPLTAPLFPAAPRPGAGPDDVDDPFDDGPAGDVDDGFDDGLDDDFDAGFDDDFDADFDYEDAVGSLADSAARWGLFDDRGRAQVVPEPAPPPGALAPRSLRDLASDQGGVGDGEHYAGHVRVIEVPQPRGSAWIVEVSGTQVWDPRAGDNPFDLTTDLRSMAQQSTVLADGVQQALAQAQAAAGAEPSAGVAAPVMLTGHSLGGIAAAGLASSPRFTARHRVTHLVTFGAPIARMPVPSATQVLSLEHTRDPVPRLEGQPNPDRATWVTVTRDGRPDGADRATQTHDLRGYVDTAALVDDTTDPSVARWRLSSAAFFDADRHGEPVVRDYSIRRLQG